jgi:hypothetical protein
MMQPATDRHTLANPGREIARPGPDEGRGEGERRHGGHLRKTPDAPLRLADEGGVSWCHRNSPATRPGRGGTGLLGPGNGGEPAHAWGTVHVRTREGLRPRCSAALSLFATRWDWGPRRTRLRQRISTNIRAGRDDCHGQAGILGFEPLVHAAVMAGRRSCLGCPYAGPRRQRTSAKPCRDRDAA